MPELRAVAPAVCRWHHCTTTPDKGYLFCPQHEQEWAANKADHEPEKIERQFVRHVYAEDCKLPYKPTSHDSGPPRAKGYSQPPINRVLDALSAAGCAHKASTTDVDSWGAQCPAHEDRAPSLQVKRNHEGTVWLKCWSGCAKEDVLRALGLEWRDLWEASEHDAGRKKIAKPFLDPHIRSAMLEAIRLDDERRAA